MEERTGTHRKENRRRSEEIGSKSGPPELFEVIHFMLVSYKNILHFIDRPVFMNVLNNIFEYYLLYRN